MPCTSLENLASASHPTFLSLSGNLNMHTAWTECSLASQLQLVGSLAPWQRRRCAALMSRSPNNPPSTESSSCTLWGSGTGAPITASRRQGTLHQKPVPCKSQQLLRLRTNEANRFLPPPALCYGLRDWGHLQHLLSAPSFLLGCWVLPSFTFIKRPLQIGTSLDV